MSESDHQAAVVKWFRVSYPEFRRLLIPSQSGVMIGGKSKFGIIAKQKREGWICGVPDLFIAIPKGGYSGLWIELKDAGKTYSAVSAEQREYISDLETAGYKAIWCAGSESAIDEIKSYLSQK